MPNEVTPPTTDDFDAEIERIQSEEREENKRHAKAIEMLDERRRQLRAHLAEAFRLMNRGAR